MQVENPNNKVGVLLIGLNGAVANTIVVGIVSEHVGYASSRLGMITTSAPFNALSLVAPSRMVVSGWDIFDENAYESALRNTVHEKQLVESVKTSLESITPWPGIRRRQDIDDQLDGAISMEEATPSETVAAIRQDIESFRVKNDLSHIIVLDVSSAEKSWELTPGYDSADSILKKIEDESSDLSSGILYAVAAIQSGCAYVDFTPNLTLLAKGLWELAERHQVPIAGKDGNTGQTLMKTVLARLLRIRNLKLEGWYSTNILGNRDGEVLVRDAHQKAKMTDKQRVLEPILGYSDFDHVVTIDYYPPRGDNKEAWDNIDFLGWFERPMQCKINWLGRDSILAAPMLLDICRLMDFSLRKDLHGIQNQLSLYFKHPINAAEFDFFSQYEHLVRFYNRYKNC